MRVVLSLRFSPFERNAAGGGPVTILARRTRRVRLERPIDRPGIAIQDIGNAIATVRVDCVEDVDVGVQDERGGRRVAATPRPPCGRRAVLGVARARVGAVLEQDGRSLAIAGPGRCMERRISPGVFDGGILIVFHVDDREPRPVALRGAQQPLDDFSGCAAARADEEARP
jgi:hypothetical protein